MKRLWLLLFLAAIPAFAQLPVRHQVFTVTSQAPTEWISAMTQGGSFVPNWTVTLITGAGAAEPDTCEIQLEGCAESSLLDCTAERIIVTPATAPNASTSTPDCKTTQALVCVESCSFRWVRMNPTAFTGTDKTLRVVMTGWR